MPGSPQRKQPKPAGSFHESKDYNTGKRSVYHEIEVPGRQSHEPHAIRAHARETSTNQWQVRVHHGPHAEKDESGSYYKHVDEFSHTGPLSSLKPKLKRSTSEQFKGLRS